MKYVVLIHSNPRPWGHPVAEHLPEYAAMTEQERQDHRRRFEELLAELEDSGELVRGEALGSPDGAMLYRWDDGAATAGSGPYAETKEHLAGLFVLDVADASRARVIGEAFAAPGRTVELRSVMECSG